MFSDDNPSQIEAERGNVAIIAAGLIALQWLSGWPNLIDGIGVAIMNADASEGGPG